MFLQCDWHTDHDGRDCLPSYDRSSDSGTGVSNYFKTLHKRNRSPRSVCSWVPSEAVGVVSPKYLVRAVELKKRVCREA